MNRDANLILEKITSRRTGMIALLILLFLPNLTVAIAGYSHTLTVGVFFVLVSIYLIILLSYSGIKFLIPTLLFSVSSILAIYIRPESIIIILSLYLLLMIKRNIKILNKVCFLCLSLVLISTGIFFHAKFIKQKSNSVTAGIFSDKKYSYLAFIHAYCLHTGANINDTTAIKLSARYFGTPESNDWSIYNAIKKNPHAEVLNILSNT